MNVSLHSKNAIRNEFRVWVLAFLIMLALSIVSDLVRKYLVHYEKCFQSSASIYTTMMDIPAVQQLAVIGVPDGLLVRFISQETNASIYFPTVSDRHFGATAFYLSGSVPAIMEARKYIQVS